MERAGVDEERKEILLAMRTYVKDGLSKLNTANIMHQYFSDLPQ